MNLTSESVIHEVLRAYSPRIAPVRVESLGNRGGFSGASIWRVVTSAGDFALRRWPATGLPRPRIIGLHRLLEHLKSDGLPFVAVPLRTSSGNSLLQMAEADWQLEPWLPGAADFRLWPSRERLARTMESLAQWHHGARKYVPSADCATWFTCRRETESPAATERLESLGRVDSDQIALVAQTIERSTEEAIRQYAKRLLAAFERSSRCIMAELRQVRHLKFFLQPCLRDVWHDHILLSKNFVTGIIDASACRAENVASDLSRLIGSLVHDDREAWDFAITEYQRHRPLSTDELALVTVLDRSGVLLSGWTWLQWLFLERRFVADLDLIAGRLAEIAGRMEKLIETGQGSGAMLYIP